MPVPGDEPLTLTQAELDAKIAEANAALESNRNTLLAEKKKLEKEMARFKDIDPDKYRTLTEREAEIEKEKAERAGDWSKREAQLQERFTKETESKDGRIKSLSSALERRLVDAEATSAVAAAKGSPKVLLPHIKAHVKVVEDNGEFVVQVVDSNGNPRVGDAKGNPMTIAQLVEELKADPDFARNFEGSGSSGGGASKSTASGGGGAATKTIASTNSPDFLANLESVAKGITKISA
jgi:hypothetical protein